jgi:hypothetical protein
VRVQTLKASGPSPRTAYAEVELGPQLSLVGVGALQTRGQAGILDGSACPALDAACRLEPRHGGDKLGTGEPERGRKRLPAVVERRLFRDRRVPERTARDDAPEGSRRPA